MKRYLHAALACSAFPLVGSLLIYVLWATTGTPWGQLLMWGLLFVSVVTLPIGVIALVIYAGLPDEEGERTRRQLILQVAVASLLLLLGPTLCFLLARAIRHSDGRTDGRTEAASAPPSTAGHLPRRRVQGPRSEPGRMLTTPEGRDPLGRTPPDAAPSTVHVRVAGMVKSLGIT